MDELARLMLPVNSFTTVKEKKIAPKRNPNESPIMQLTNLPKLTLSRHSPVLTIYAIFNSPDHCFFMNRDDPTDDYFYKCILTLHKQHIKFLGSDYDVNTYRVPYSAQGFKIKSTKNFLLCYDVYGKIIPSDGLKGHKVKLKLHIKPYDFVSKTTKKRLIGLTILVNEIIKC